LGQVADDYGLSKLQVVYYPKSKPEAKRGTIPVKTSDMNSFIFFSGSGLAVEQGVSYEYYFEVLIMMHFMVLKVQNLRCFLIELVPMRRRKANCWNSKGNINSLQKSR
jgi:hypothetical protein